MASRVESQLRLSNTQPGAHHQSNRPSVVGDCGKGPRRKFTFSPRNPVRNRPNSFASAAERLGPHFTHHFGHFRARQIGVNIYRKIRNRPSLCVCIRGWEKSSKHTIEWTFSSLSLGRALTNTLKAGGVILTTRTRFAPCISVGANGVCVRAPLNAFCLDASLTVILLGSIFFYTLKA